MNKYYIVNFLYTLISIYINNISDEIECDDIKIKYDDSSKLLTIASSDGRKLTFSISEEKKKEVDYQGNINYYYLIVLDSNISLKNGDIINFHSDYPIFSNDKDTINITEIFYNLSINYYEKDNPIYANIFPNFDKIYFSNSKLLYEFKDDSIKCGDMILSSDGKKLLTIDGVDISKIKSFITLDYIKENKEIYDLLFNENKILNIEDGMNKINTLEKVKDIVDRANIFYNNEQKNAIRAYNIRKKAIDGLKNESIKLNELLNINEMIINKKGTVKTKKYS